MAKKVEVVSESNPDMVGTFTIPDEVAPAESAAPTSAVVANLGMVAVPATKALPKTEFKLPNGTTIRNY